MKDIVFYIVLMFLSSLAASYSQILLKKSTMVEHKNMIASYLNLKVIFAYLILSSTMLVNILAFTKVPFKYGSIIMSSSYIFTLILSRLILKEENSRQSILGNLIILLGIVIYSR